MRAVLGVSLLLNALLLILAALRFGPGQPVDSARRPVLTQSPSLRTQSVSNPAAPTFPTRPENRTGWDWIESRDYRQLITNLRRVGCPEQTIQEIVCMRICRSLRQRLLQETAEMQRALPYWKAPSPQQGREQIALRQKVHGEVDRALEELFGEDGRAVRFRVAGMPNRDLDKDYLPAEKASRVREIERQYREAAYELPDVNLPFGFTDPEMQESRAALERHKLAEVRQVLTPEEYELYLLHSSAAANYVRAQLPEAQSEDEFKRMLQVALEFEMDGASRSMAARYGIQDPDDEAARAQQEKEQAFQRRLAEEFGSDRLAAQKEAETRRELAEREVESRRRSITEITAIGATEEEAGKLLDRLMAIQPKLEQRAKELMPDNPTPEQRKAFAAVLKTEMEQAATEIMGPAKARALIEKMERESKR